MTWKCCCWAKLRVKELETLTRVKTKAKKFATTANANGEIGSKCETTGSDQGDHDALMAMTGDDYSKQVTPVCTWAGSGAR